MFKKTIYEQFTQIMAKVEFIVWFQSRVRFCLLAFITLSIFVRFPKGVQNLS